MPTIPQLPSAGSSGGEDELPVSQAGVTRSVTVSELLSGTQPAIELPSAALLGRVSMGPGGPEPVSVSTGLAISAGTLVANGSDHASFSLQPQIGSGDEVIVNAAGTPGRRPAQALRGLFSAGANVSISTGGTISATTDPGVTSQLGGLVTSLAATNNEVAALSAKIPAGGYVSLNAQGQITAPSAGPVTLATVAVGTGMPSRTLQQKSTDVLNVLDFGAVNGLADSSAGFNAAFAALPPSGGEIFIPPGDYHIGSSLVWSGKALTVRGSGKGVSRVHFAHTGIGFDIAQSDPTKRTVLRDFSAYAESASGQTGAVARLNYPAELSFGYVSAHISDIECFGYPNSSSGNAPFPQSFLRGFILLNTWSVQVNNVSWFGPPAAAGTTSSAILEINRAIDTRIAGLQAYYGNAAVLQTGYCEGVYFTNPLIVGTDYLFRQTDITGWPGYAPNKLMLLGLWAANGEINCNLGTVQGAAIGGAYFVGCDVTRDGGPNTSQSLFDLTNCSNFFVLGCNFVGGPSGGANQDIAFNFHSTFNSSGNVIGGCSFQDMATIIKISTANGTVGLTTFGLNPANVPISTAFLDNSDPANGNLITFQSPATSTAPSGIGNTRDHLFTAGDGSPLFRIANVLSADNYLRHQAATTSNPPKIIFDGTDGSVNGVIQTKGGSLFINASGGTSNSGNLISLLNMPGASNWVTVQNATAGNLCSMSTNVGGMAISPQGPLWLSPNGGLFVGNLPTSKPTAGSRQLWNNNGLLGIA